MGKTFLRGAFVVAVAAFGALASHAALIDLPAPAMRKVEAERIEDAGSGGVQQIGFERLVPKRDADDARGASLLQVRSSGARALRVAIAAEAPASGWSLRVAGADGIASIVDASVVKAAIASRGVYWTPVTSGDMQAIQVVGQATAASAVRMTAVSVSHLSADPSKAGNDGKAGGCNVDAGCPEPTPAIVQAMRSVAKLVYTVDGATFTCTGTLVTSGGVMAAPFVLTAKHCIGSEAAAATINSYWFLEATECLRATSLPVVQLTRGGRLAYASGVSDVALVRLNELAPAQALPTEIDGAGLAAGMNVLALHHPRGDYKKVSSGIVSNPAEGTSGTLIAVSWMVGTTEPGSSGSALFVEKAGRYVVRGTLRGGSASCANAGALQDPSNRDYYASLETDWQPLVAALGVAATPLANYTDMWIAPALPGNGISITHHANDGVFVAWFTYDDTGAATWLTLQGGRWIDARTYAGSVYRTDKRSGAARTEVAGSARLVFTDDRNASLQVTLGAAQQSYALERFAF